jgi:hypothetical protein
MSANLLLRVACLAGGSALALCVAAWAQAPPSSPPGASTAGEQWVTTDQSMLDYVEDGYELVSVVGTSSQVRLYFLSKPGKVVKCREESAPGAPPPLPPPPVRGQAPTAFVPDLTVPEVRIETECAELIRPSSTGKR